jgi:uncharacterized protein (TIGR00251 family)
MAALEIGGAGDELRIRVRVKPRAARSRVLSAAGDVVEVAVAAPPVDGEANEELVRLLASVLGIARRNVEIVSGVHGRTKLLRVRGLTGVELTSRLSAGETKR